MGAIVDAGGPMTRQLRQFKQEKFIVWTRIMVAGWIWGYLGSIIEWACCWLNKRGQELLTGKNFLMIVIAVVEIGKVGRGPSQMRL